MLEMRELTLEGILIRIIVSIILGGIIGLDRGMKNRAAGLRTYMLVCIGSCVVMMVNQYIYQVYGTGDPVRMGAQVVSGIGFLGAGTIIVTSHNQVRGLTTAAGLWASACIGLAVGIGLYEVALIGGIAVTFVLAILSHWDYRFRHSQKVAEVYIEFDKNASFGNILRSIRRMDVEISNLQLIQEMGGSNDLICFTATISRRKKFDHKELFSKIEELEGIFYLEEL